MVLDVYIYMCSTTLPLKTGCLIILLTNNRWFCVFINNMEACSRMLLFGQNIVFNIRTHSRTVTQKQFMNWFYDKIIENR